jgi:hypothetical protein
MNEKLLQFIWQFQYFNAAGLETVNGEVIKIVHPGQINNNQGPDFLNAKIRVSDTLLAGSVELHLKTSQWVQHQHSSDPHYNNVILHVVLENDVMIRHAIPTLELKGRISGLLLQRYEGLLHAGNFIPCGEAVLDAPDLTWISWKERLMAERLSRKGQLIIDHVKRNNGHWEETFWQLLARNFGARLNADLFEAVAKSLPVKTLGRHKNQVIQLEALLMGQANLLEARFAEAYPFMLKKEYRFYQRKYNLERVHIRPVFHRMRPAGFPTVRLAQLAMLVHGSAHLFSNVMEQKTVKDVKKLLELTANDYWHYHYRFDEASSFQLKRLGTEMVNNIIINTMVPIMFAYGNYRGEAVTKARAVQWLEELEAENNAITNGFSKLKITGQSAFDSQALIELKTSYCDLRRCLDCSIGNHLLKTGSRGDPATLISSD